MGIERIIKVNICPLTWGDILGLGLLSTTLPVADGSCIACCIYYGRKYIAYIYTVETLLRRQTPMHNYTCSGSNRAIYA